MQAVGSLVEPAGSRGPAGGCSGENAAKSPVSEIRNREGAVDLEEEEVVVVEVVGVTWGRLRVRSVSQ